MDTNITNKYGTLLTPDAKLHRQWFKEMVKLLGINVIYRAVKEGKKIAYLMEKGIPSERLCAVMQEAQAERAKGNQILVARMNKNKKFQKEQLTAQGYEEFKEFYCEELRH